MDINSYLGEVVIVSSEAIKSPLKNSCHAAKGHKNPDVIIDIAKGTSIIISFSVGFEV